MPVYNAEKYLDRSIKSIINQGFDNWILWAIDDGSTDRSGAILDAYELEDSRINVIHQRNKGVSAARQLGIDKSEGKYCIQVDSDDWVEPDYLSNLVKCAEENNADMVWCDSFRNEEEIWRHECIEEPVEMIGSILKEKCWGTLWNRLIKTDICKLREVRFPQGCKMWEDKAFVISVLVYCNKIVHCKKCLYHYTTNNENSLLHRQFNENMQEDLKKAINQIESVLENRGFTQFSKELNKMKLMAIKEYVDDKRRTDYYRYLNTAPEALDHIAEYPDFPQRHIYLYWAIKNRQIWMIPIIMKIDSLIRRIIP